MIFYSSLGILEINKLTYLEAEELFIFYNEREIEKIEAFFSLFAFHNMESTRVATHGDQNNCKRYIENLRHKHDVVKDNDIEQQFKEANFAK